MSDTESDEEYESIPFTEDPVCYSIDPTFCKLTFDLKRALYSEIVLTGDEMNDKQQDLAILEQYKTFLDILHGLLYGLFTPNNTADKPIPTQVLDALPLKTREALIILYPTICQAIKTNRENHNTENNKVYGYFIHRMFHDHPFEMSTDEPERD